MTDQDWLEADLEDDSKLRAGESFLGSSAPPTSARPKHEILENSCPRASSLLAFLWSPIRVSCRSSRIDRVINRPVIADDTPILFYPGRDIVRHAIGAEKRATVLCARLVAWFDWNCQSKRLVDPR